MNSTSIKFVRQQLEKQLTGKKLVVEEEIGFQDLRVGCYLIEITIQIYFDEGMTRFHGRTQFSTGLITLKRAITTSDTATHHSLTEIAPSATAWRRTIVRFSIRATPSCFTRENLTLMICLRTVYLTSASFSSITKIRPTVAWRHATLTKTSSIGPWRTDSTQILYPGSLTVSWKLRNLHNRRSIYRARIERWLGSYLTARRIANGTGPSMNYPNSSMWTFTGNAVKWFAILTANATFKQL